MSMMLSEGEVTPSPPSIRSRRTATGQRPPSKLRLSGSALEEAESFLQALKDEVSPRADQTLMPSSQPEEGEIRLSPSPARPLPEEDEIGSSPTRTDAGRPQPGRVDSELGRPVDRQTVAHRRRESQIWEGDFELSDISANGKRKRVGADLEDEEDDDDVAAPLDPVQISMETFAYKPGRKAASIIKILFDVDAEVAEAVRRWKETSLEGPSMRISFGCCPKGFFASDHVRKSTDIEIEAAATAPSVSAQSVMSIQLDEKIWTPLDLAGRGKPIDISHFVKSGRNELQIVQVTDCSDLCFVVFASQPSTKDLDHSRAKRRLIEYVRSCANPG